MTAGASDRQRFADVDGAPIIRVIPDCQPGKFWWNCDPLPRHFPGPAVWFDLEFIERLYSNTTPGYGGPWMISGDDRRAPFKLAWRMWTESGVRFYAWELLRPPILTTSLPRCRLGLWCAWP